jgi:hypothetical protein
LGIFSVHQLNKRYGKIWIEDSRNLRGEVFGVVLKFFQNCSSSNNQNLVIFDENNRQ